MSDHSFAHLLRLSTGIGTFEHADHTVPRASHGYCTDDMARVLIAVVRETNPTAELRELGRVAYRFLDDAQAVDGRMRNRRSVTGRWEDRPTVEDCWGRSVWAFGVAAHHAGDDWLRQAARSSFDHGIEQRAPWPHAMAFAALGAADVLAEHPGDRGARALLEDAVVTIGAPADDDTWPWPTKRLSYANAALAEALLAAGAALERDDVVRDGLRMLRWLLDRETVDGHLSPTPVGGSGPGDAPVRFDQQPIEVAAMAEACVRAAQVSGDTAWLDGLLMAADWFHGHNDAGAVMGDPATGGGFDGLTPDGPNLNQGAESTLARITTLQLAAHLVRTPR